VILPEAVSRSDIADFVSALFLVYIVLIFVRILMSWVPQIPRSATLRPILDFVTETTDPYLNVFRRFIPPLGMLDISPIIAVFVLLIAQALIVSAING
jgi:YggT family protein